jgi:hypothetical protein
MRNITDELQVTRANITQGKLHDNLPPAKEGILCAKVIIAGSIGTLRIRLIDTHCRNHRRPN